MLSRDCLCAWSAIAAKLGYLGKHPKTIKKELTEIVNDAYEDFLEQTKLPE